MCIPGAVLYAGLRYFARIKFNIMSNFKRTGFSLIIILFSMASFAQGLTSVQIDSLVNLTLKTFDVPGIAVAIVKDGQVIH